MVPTLRDIQQVALFSHPTSGWWSNKKRQPVPQGGIKVLFGTFGVLFYLKGSKVQTSNYSLFANLLDTFKEKASVLDAMFLHIQYSDILREKFVKANVYINELSNY